MRSVTGLESLTLDDGSHWGFSREMSPGDAIPPHAGDGIHPSLPLVRAVTLLIFLHERWNRGWGGEFVLKDAKEIAPLPGRAIIFWTDPEHIHSVAPVLGPISRKSMGVYFYLPGGTSPVMRGSE